MKDVCYRDWNKWKQVFITENNGDYYMYKYTTNGNVQYLKWEYSFWRVVAGFNVKKLR